MCGYYEDDPALRWTERCSTGAAVVGYLCRMAGAGPAPAGAWVADFAGAITAAAAAGDAVRDAGYSLALGLEAAADLDRALEDSRAALAGLESVRAGVREPGGDEVCGTAEDVVDALYALAEADRETPCHWATHLAGAVEAGAALEAALRVEESYHSCPRSRKICRQAADAARPALDRAVAALVCLNPEEQFAAPILEAAIDRLRKSLADPVLEAAIAKLREASD